MSLSLILIVSLLLVLTAQRGVASGMHTCNQSLALCTSFPSHRPSTDRAATAAAARSLPQHKWYNCNDSNCSTKKTGCVCASTYPPHHLPPPDTPQFILLTHDDVVTYESTAKIDAMLATLRHPNGCRIPTTYFILTNGSDPLEVRRRWEMGDEVGGHAEQHLNQAGAEITRKDKENEILGSREWAIQGAGIPQEDVVGYRTPFLAETPEQRQILETAGFLYDSSIVESVKTEEGKRNRIWPYRMDAGLPQHRHQVKKGSEGDERHKGLWEIPVWVLLHQGKRYCMDPGRGGEGNDEEEDVFEVLKSNLEASYDGNRAPLPLYIHTFWFDGQRERRAREFVEYSLKKPGVYFVTMKMLVEWMQAPVGVGGMDAWLSRRCDGPGAATGEGRGLGGKETKADANTVGITMMKNHEMQQDNRIHSSSVVVAACSVGLVTVVLARRRRGRRAASAAAHAHAHTHAATTPHPRPLYRAGR